MRRSTMPTYEYDCLQCGTETEAFQSMSEPPLEKCPACKGELRRRIGAGAFVKFKGSGFYETDYKKSPRKPETARV